MRYDDNINCKVYKDCLIDHQKRSSYCLTYDCTTHRHTLRPEILNLSKPHKLDTATKNFGTKTPTPKLRDCNPAKTQLHPQRFTENRRNPTNSLAFLQLLYWNLTRNLWLKQPQALCSMLGVDFDSPKNNVQLGLYIKQQGKLEISPNRCLVWY